MLEIGKRVRQIRKAEKLTQTEFGASVGVGKSMIAQVECGRVNMSERTIQFICRLYGVNEKWLRTGEGDVYVPKTRNQEIAEFLNDVLEETTADDFKKRLLIALSKLNDKDWDALATIADKIKNADI